MLYAKASLHRGFQSRYRVFPASTADMATMINMLNIALPTMVPTPTSLFTPTPATDVNSSGAEEPAAMNVALATSSDRSNLSEMASKEGTKKSDHYIYIYIYSYGYGYGYGSLFNLGRPLAKRLLY